MIVMPQNVGNDQSLDFQPASLTVAPGTTVTFVDQDSQSGAPHNVTWQTKPSGASVSNSPEVMSAGQSFTVTLTVPGTYTYDCSIHPSWMKGTIVVKAA
jgi:plastocyanin